MRTIQEKYNAIQEGNFSKSQFVKDAKRELSQFLSPFNGYEDTVAILKNKGVLTEAKKEKVTDYKPTPAGLPAEAISRGIDYELEAIGVNTGVEMPTQKQLDKVTSKVHKNLAKNMNHYLDLIAGESKKVDKHDRSVEATKKNSIDTFNGMKKAELRESVVEKAMSKGYSKKQVEGALARLKEKKGKDLNNDDKVDSKDYMMAKDKAIKNAMKKEEITVPNSTLAQVNQAVTSPATLAQTFLSIYQQVQKKEQKDFSQHSKFSKVLNILTSMAGDKEEEEVNEVEASIDPQKLEDMGYSAGEKALMDLDPEIFNQPNFNSYASGFIKGFQDNIEASQDYAAHYVNEGRRKKSKGGKIVTENDYETGGYIESMGPLFDRACDMLAKAFGEWVNGPMTEPGMIAPAKKDVINYLDQKLTSQFLEESNSVEESIDREFHSTSDTSGHPDPSKMSVPEIEAYIKDNPTTLWGRSLSIWKMVLNKKKGADTVRDEQLKEAFKAIISKVLTEEIITEAATGNLSKIADTYNDYEGMQVAVNALENIVTDIESYNSKTRDKIQKIYDSLKDIKNKDGLVVGSFIAPAIAQAFSKDLIPVSDKGFTSKLTLPKTKVLKAGDVQEEELDEKETVFSPVTESRKRKYTKR